MLFFKTHFGCCVGISCNATTMEAGRDVGGDGDKGQWGEDMHRFGPGGGQSRQMY